MLNKTIKTIVMTSALISTVALCACGNTVRGAGRDIENAGETVQDTVD